LSRNHSITNLPIVIIACQVFQDLLLRFVPADLNGSVSFMDYGLHRTPNKLARALQESIDRVEVPSLIVLGYGLCGNGLNGIKAGKHTLLVPRADDCIAMLLGSYAAYRKEFDSVPGTYYLSKGWLESGSNPLSEYQEYEKRLGSEKAMWVMDQQYQHYKRLVFVAHSQEDLEAYRPKAKEVARFCQRWGMRYEEIIGSDLFIRQLVEVTYLPEKTNEDFVLIQPGGELRQADFIR
jgi:Protein of unknown function (DUF1638)